MRAAGTVVTVAAKAHMVMTVMSAVVIMTTAGVSGKSGGYW